MTASTPAITVDCHVRASSLVAPVDSTVETLRSYAAAGEIDEVHVETWPDEVPLTGPNEDATVLERYETFQAWADCHGVQLSPAFSVRERSTVLSDTASTMLVLPMVCLVIHVGGTLASVVPHTTATTAYTVSDALTDLREVDTVPIPPAVATPAETDEPAATVPDPDEPDRPPMHPYH